LAYLQDLSAETVVVLFLQNPGWQLLSAIHTHCYESAARLAFEIGMVIADILS
jgi:hypothetical protein